MLGNSTGYKTTLAFLLPVLRAELDAPMERMESLPSASCSSPKFLKSQESLSWQHSHSPKEHRFQRGFPLSISLGKLCLPPWDFSSWDSRIRSKFPEGSNGNCCSRNGHIPVASQRVERRRNHYSNRIIPNFCPSWGKIFLRRSFGPA